MKRTSTLARSGLFALGMLSLIASRAVAADLPAQSRLGAVFAEPPPRGVRAETIEPIEDAAVFYVPPKVPGYYGKPTDFTYRNYYGTSPIAIFGRLPYACGFYALC